MSAPRLISTLRFSPAIRRQLEVVFAKAWESLAETYREQAVEFVRRLAPALPADEALDRYFRDVGVPGTMIEAVRARALIALAPVLDQLGNDSAPVVAPGETAPWPAFRIDHLFGTLRQRAQQADGLNLQCRLAACVAEEAVTATHVRMALATADTLDSVLPPDEAIMYYVRAFNLPALPAQIIFQRAMAHWASREAPADAIAMAGVDTGLGSLMVKRTNPVSVPGVQLELSPVVALGLRLRALLQ